MTQQWPFNKRSTADEVLSGRDLSGRVMVITGANSGIGFETARSLAAAGATVIMACRNPATGNQAKTKIQAAHPDSDIECRELNLASLSSIARFCDQLEHESITDVICNAGVMVPAYEETDDGIEYTFGVCHIGHFYLIQQLLPRLTSAAGSRVIMLSSESHRMPAKLDFNALPYQQDNYALMKAYDQAKLCNALLAVELNRRFADKGLMASFVHPGTLVPTNIGRRSILIRLLTLLSRPFTKSPEQGAATTVFCASWEHPEQLAGKYFSDCQPAKPSVEAQNPEVAARLWEISADLCSNATFRESD